MNKIIFDIMGNDNGIEPAILATKNFLKINPNYKVILIGDKNLIDNYDLDLSRVEIIDVKLEVKKNTNPRDNLKQENSMNIALNLLKENHGDALISSGDSASLLVSSMLHLRKIEGIDRPSFMPIIPTILENKRFLLLDVGANLSVKSEHLVQWAKMANIFSQTILDVPNPNLFLLNIGTEDNKGYEVQIEANKILKNEKNINYKGFIEPRYLLEGEADIIIADGYAGNIALKTLEGTILSFLKLMKRNLFKNIYRKILSLMLKKAFVDIKEHLDYRNVGSAWVLGVNGIVLKTHGASDDKAYLGALNQVKEFIEKDAFNKIKKGFSSDK
ncbi:MAG: phosphate acyltransferase PlsX [Metamycoplasmataceae bacterium]